MAKGDRKINVDEVMHSNLSPYMLYRKLNNLIEYVDRSTADTNSLHGDGLFPVVKDINGKVSAGSGLQVIISDYLGLIDGYKVHLSAARLFNESKNQTLTITKTGEFYVGLQLQGVAYDTTREDEDMDETEKEVQKNMKAKYGFLPSHGAALPVEIDASELDINGEVEGKIILAKLNVSEGTTQITGTMIDNSVKDYLVDVDVLRRDMTNKIDEVKRIVYQQVTDAIELLREEISNGDQDVLDTLNSKISVIEGQIADLNEDVDNIKTNLQDLNDYVVTTIAPRVDQLSQDLQDAIDDLTQLIDDETSLLDDKIGENLGKIAQLQSEVEAPTTGLLDRVTTLEDQPSLPSGILETLQDHEERIAYLEQFGGGGGGPTFVNHQIIVSDLDGSSTYSVDDAGEWVLPINTEATHPLQDTFDGNGPVDSNKWNIVYGTPQRVNDELQLKDRHVIESVKNDFDDCIITYDAIPKGVNSSPQLFAKVSGWGTSSLDAYGILISSIEKRIYLQKYENGSLVMRLYKDLPNDLVVDTPISVEAKFIGNRIIINVDNEEMFDIIEPFIPGSPKLSAGSMVFRGRLGTVHIDNVDVSLLDPVYESSGIILTTQLESTSPINKAFLQGAVSIPADTAIQYEVSLNGGVNWVTVTLSELVDGTPAPWNGTGDNYLVKMTLSTTDTSKTPKVESIIAVSQI